MVKRRHGNYYRCLVERCEYTGLRYQTKAHYAKEHLKLRNVPYLCGHCGERAIARSKAEDHQASHHDSVPFEELFAGTYQDLGDREHPNGQAK